MLNVVGNISLFGRCRVWVEISFRILLKGCPHMVSGNQHKMVSCSHLENPICNCVHIVTPFRPEQGVQNSRLPQKLPKRCARRDQVPYFEPEHKVSSLYSGTVTVPEFQRGYLKKGCVHISAQQVPNSRAPCPGTKCERCLTDAAYIDKTYTCILPRTQDVGIQCLRAL